MLRQICKIYAKFSAKYVRLALNALNLRKIYAPALILHEFNAFLASPTKFCVFTVHTSARLATNTWQNIYRLLFPSIFIEHADFDSFQ